MPSAQADTNKNKHTHTHTIFSEMQNNLPLHGIHLRSRDLNRGTLGLQSTVLTNYTTAAFTEIGKSRITLIYPKINHFRQISIAKYVAKYELSYGFDSVKLNCRPSAASNPALLQNWLLERTRYPLLHGRHLTIGAIL